jgi:phosphoglycolate phosphatase-like HAD superfamily hydrolase
MIRAVLFDFDGVIAESVDVKTRAFAELYEEFGPEIVEKVIAYHLANGGVSRFDKIRHYHENYLGRTIGEEELKLWCDRFSGLVLEGVVSAPYVPGALETLEACKKKYSCFIVTGTPEDEMEIILDRRGLGDYFKGVHGSPRKKKEIVHTILENHDFRPKEVVYIGDAMTDYEAAKAANVGFIGRVPEGHSNTFPPDVITVPDLRGLKIEQKRPGH